MAWAARGAPGRGRGCGHRVLAGRLLLGVTLSLLAASAALGGEPGSGCGSWGRGGEAIPVEPTRAGPLKILSPEMHGDALCFRVRQAAGVGRWVDIYATGIEADGNRVELGFLGSLGPVATVVAGFGTLDGLSPDASAPAGRTPPAVFPPMEETPIEIPRARRFTRLEVEVVGLGLAGDEPLDEEAFRRFLVASTPTVLFEVLGQVPEVVAAARQAGGARRGAAGDGSGRSRSPERAAVHRSGRVRRLLEALVAGLDGATGDEVQALYRLYRNGERYELGWEMIRSIDEELGQLCEERPGLVGDAMVELGLDRRLWCGEWEPLAAGWLDRLIARMIASPEQQAEVLAEELGRQAGGRLKGALGVFLQATESVHEAVMETLATAAVLEPVTTFRLAIDSERTLPMLFALDTSASMHQDGKMERLREATLGRVEGLARSRDPRHGVPVVGILTFSGSCSASSVRPLSEFDRDLERVARRLDEAPLEPAGRTPLPEAVAVAEERLRTYLDAHPGASEGRLLVVSDGESTCGPLRSGLSDPRPTLATFPEGSITIRIDALGLDLEPGSAAERDLQHLSSAHGGRYLSARDPRQLDRVLERTTRPVVPKGLPPGGGLGPVWALRFLEGREALRSGDGEAAVAVYRHLLERLPAVPAAHYNLALALEGAQRYRAAAGHLERYLELAPEAPDRAAVSARIRRLERDHADHRLQQVALLRSDLEYLEGYYQALFEGSRAELAREFRGFLRDRAELYATLPAWLGVEERWLERASEQLGRDLDRVAARLDEPTFDRDAVSLLAPPIGRLEELVERLEGRLGTGDG